MLKSKKRKLDNKHKELLYRRFIPLERQFGSRQTLWDDFQAGRFLQQEVENKTWFPKEVQEQSKPDLWCKHRGEARRME